MKTKVLIVFGTRPEAIKMAPLIREFQKNSDSFDLRVAVTAQHREMLDQVLRFFELKPDYDLNLMRPNQNLHQLTADVVTQIKPVLEEFKPDYVFVHGDTTTSTATALAAFYCGIQVCHVEAGLRTYNTLSPFPEEMNRQITGRIANLHFAPTELSKRNLVGEKICESNIKVVGNTVIDALLWAVEKLKTYEDDEITMLKEVVEPTKKVVLVTGHRRENFGDGFINICKALIEIAKLPNTQIIYPVHLNPNVQGVVFSLLNNNANIRLINPLSYPSFVWLMNKSYLILTDSGGIQEEAPSLGKPILVMRDTTERPEAISSGTAMLVGTDTKKIVYEVTKLINDDEYYQLLESATNPYGEGKTSEKIVGHVASKVKDASKKQ